MSTSITYQEFESILDDVGPGSLNADQFRHMSTLILDIPAARDLAELHPNSQTYKDAAMALYLHLRGREGDGYVVARDELTRTAQPDSVWTGVPPWSFQNGSMLSEHLYAWGHIFAHLNLPPQGTLLEYGPGSGQVLLMAARLGHEVFGVDIDSTALAGIQAQASHLQLPVETEIGEFGKGFDGRVFDTILFYEAFHHAFEFADLLRVLHQRLKPGGRIVLCGEPIVDTPCGPVPYPWDRDWMRYRYSACGASVGWNSASHMIILWK